MFEGTLDSELTVGQFTKDCEGTDKLTRGHGPELHKLGSHNRKYLLGLHFEPH